MSEIEGLFTTFADAIASAVAQRIEAQVRHAAADRIAPRWLDLAGAAQLMNTTKAAVRGMARAGLFPVKRMGSRVMIDIKGLEKAFDQRTAWLS